MFKETILDKMVRSFQKMEKLRQEYLQTQSEAFDYLEQWANLNSNTGIKDVTSEFKHLSIQVEKNSSPCDFLINMSKMFKEYEDQLKRFKKKNEKIGTKLHCNNSDNKESFEKEIAVSKSIVFKSKIKKYTEKIQQQFRNQKIFLKALNDMVNQLPDVSAIETDDISEIIYTNQNDIINISKKALESLKKVNDNKIINSNLYPSLDKFIPNSDIPKTPPPCYLDSMKKSLDDSPTPAYDQIFYKKF